MLWAYNTDISMEVLFRLKCVFSHVQMAVGKCGLILLLQQTYTF